MKSTLKLLPSLFVTIVMSSLAPVMICGLILALCSVLWSCPGVTAAIPQDGLKEFLQVFGNGSAVEGILTIAITFGFVGGMFEAFNFYYYQNTN
ncbi:hypothetical protein [[Limnothrix rosea] IAM M-220]|uniref:hypothetical protein n=1 Tax=[Limnothrix rosea] IAM M-220 TaxID=454133 RepID=UPI00095AC88D|nr:hypothetical protein [[Limnothrix rosea] IAM M-220]OKH15916.1 hypothetical protein NIES208_12515 [[Limnothrix rosea] IAM M-220]